MDLSPEAILDWNVRAGVAGMLARFSPKLL
jgi:hypothetical protein